MNRYRPAVIIAAFALLAVVAVAGWVRPPHTAAAAGATPYIDLNSTAAPASTIPCVESTGYAERANASVSAPDERIVYPSEQYYARRPVRVVRNEYVEPVQAQRVRTEYVERPVVRHGRSTKKSIAIVAGSSGVGAAIGALAGGGKGAGIGALAGGAGGFIYDRLTHKR